MNIVELAHSKFLATQRFYRFVLNLEPFIVSLDYNNQVELREMIEKVNLVGFRKKINTLLEKDLDFQPVLKLRKLAKQQSIKNWNYLSKAGLIDAIRKKVKDDEINVSK